MGTRKVTATAKNRSDLLEQASRLQEQGSTVKPGMQPDVLFEVSELGNRCCVELRVELKGFESPDLLHAM
jgi:hypothetical protein